MGYDLNDPELQALIEKAAEEKVSGLKNKKDELLGKLTETKKRYDGIDPDEYYKLKTEAERRAQLEAERERKLQEERGEFTKILEKEKEEFQRIQEAKDKQINKYKEAFYKTQLTNEAQKAIQSQGGNPLFLEHHVMSRLALEETEEGLFRTVVKNQDGTKMLREDGSLATPMDLVKKLREDQNFAPAFRGSGAGGSGEAGTGTVTVEVKNNPFSKEHYSLTEQMKLMQLDPKKAQMLKEQAGV